MKNNIKAKIKLASICASAIMTLSGCGSKHTNVIEAKNDTEKLWIIKDVTTGEKRFFDYTNAARESVIPFDFFRVGDTVSFRIGVLYNDRHLYCQSPIIDSKFFEIKYNKKVLTYRQDSMRCAEVISKLTERFNNQR